MEEEEKLEMSRAQSQSDGTEASKRGGKCLECGMPASMKIGENKWICENCYHDYSSCGGECNEDERTKDAA